MSKTAIGFLVTVTLLLPGAQRAYARGCGGMHASTNSQSRGDYHGGSSSAEAYHGPGGTAVKGPDDNVYAHKSSSDNAYHAAGGTTAVHSSVGTVVKSPSDNVYVRQSSSGGAYYGAAGTNYVGRTVAYSDVHTALPTDAGYGMSTAAARRRR